MAWREVSSSVVLVRKDWREDRREERVSSSLSWGWVGEGESVNQRFLLTVSIHPSLPPSLPPLLALGLQGRSCLFCLLLGRQFLL